jgi:hypothetical protein
LQLSFDLQGQLTLKHEEELLRGRSGRTSLEASALLETSS